MFLGRSTLVMSFPTEAAMKAAASNISCRRLLLISSQTCQNKLLKRWRLCTPSSSSHTFLLLHPILLYSSRPYTTLPSPDGLVLQVDPLLCVTPLLFPSSLNRPGQDGLLSVLRVSLRFSCGSAVAFPWAGLAAHTLSQPFEIISRHNCRYTGIFDRVEPETLTICLRDGQCGSPR